MFAVSAWLCFLKKQGAMLCLSSFAIGLRWNLNDSADHNVGVGHFCVQKKVIGLLSNGILALFEERVFLFQTIFLDPCIIDQILDR